jgi:Domain of unknown function (DUF6285)
MQDTPDHAEILAAVTALLRDEIIPLFSGRPSYQIRVAANALDLVGRQMTMQDGFDAAEHARLVNLLGRDGELMALNQLLCEAIESHALTLESPGLAEHLWATTMAKLAVDQPRYARYQAELKYEPA